MLASAFGLGEVESTGLSLVCSAWATFGSHDLAPEDMDQEEAMRLTQRLMSGRFTLNDMYKQNK